MPINSVGKEEMRGEGRERATVPLSFGSGDVSYTPKLLKTTGATGPAGHFHKYFSRRSS